MTWEDKLLRIREVGDANMTVVLFSGLTEPGAPPVFLERAKMRWPFLPASYLKFLALTDGAQLDLFVLYGSGESRYPSLFDENDRRRRSGNGLQTTIAIGEDADGDAFLMEPNGAIYIQRSDPPRTPLVVAVNFDDLLDQVMLGPRYYAFFSQPRRHTDWGDFLREEGWATGPKE